MALGPTCQALDEGNFLVEQLKNLSSGCAGLNMGANMGLTPGPNMALQVVARLSLSGSLLDVAFRCKGSSLWEKMGTTRSPGEVQSVLCGIVVHILFS